LPLVLKLVRMGEARRMYRSGSEYVMLDGLAVAVPRQHSDDNREGIAGRRRRADRTCGF